MIVRIERMEYGGAGVGKDVDGDGCRDTAVALTLPGELVEFDPATGKLVRVIEASAARVMPCCPHFGVCGGCQLQHADYAVQVAGKSQILRGILEQAGFRSLPKIEIVTGQPWGYRNRIRLRMQVVDGSLRVGYSRRASNQFLAIRECPIAAPVVWHAAEALLRLAADAKTRSWLERVAEVEIFAAIPDLGEPAKVQICFFLADSEAARRQPFAELCERLKALLPELAGASAEIDPEAGRRLRRSWPGAKWSADGLVYSVGEARYWVTRGAFFQVNRFLVSEMLSLVSAGRSGALAWDLFAGVGLFSRVLAANFTKVVAVEGNPVAAADLARLAKNVDAVHQPTLDFLRRAVLERDRPELVVLDPPRAGAGPEACALLGRIAPAFIVYVSCDALSLARDLAVLLRSGYTLERVCLIDMFPQTLHIETIVWLRRTL
jgi:23S rRNA (uracil1939-C5)-methyltransferase